MRIDSHRLTLAIAQISVDGNHALKPDIEIQIEIEPSSPSLFLETGL
jgi:hypothetical protein